jgi:hypothetical protein
MDDPDAPPSRNFAGSEDGKGINGNEQRYRNKRGVVGIDFEEGGAGSGSAVGGAVAMDVVDVDAAAAAVAAAAAAAAARNSSGGGQDEEEDKENVLRDSRRAKKLKTSTGGVMASQLESLVHNTSEGNPYIARRLFYREQLNIAAW